MGSDISMSASTADGTSSQGLNGISLRMGHEPKTHLDPKFHPTEGFPRPNAEKMKEAYAMKQAGMLNQAEWETEKAKLLAGLPSTLQTNAFLPPDEVLDVFSVCTFGLFPTDKPLLPVGPNTTSMCVFDCTALRAYCAGNFHTEPRAEIIEIEGSSFKKFSESHEAKLSLGFEKKKCCKLGAGGSASLAAEFGLKNSGSEHSYYVQHRSSFTIGHVTLPSTTLNVKGNPTGDANLTDIQALMNPKILSMLNNVTPESAPLVVDSIGPFYVCRADFGAVRTYTSNISKSKCSSMMDLSVAVKGQYSAASVSGNAAVSYSMASENFEGSSEANVTIRTFGGDPFTTENEQEWLASAGGNPVIIKYELAPIYELVWFSDDAASPYQLLKTRCDEISATMDEAFDDLINRHDRDPLLSMCDGYYKLKARGWYMTNTTDPTQGPGTQVKWCKNASDVNQMIWKIEAAAGKPGQFHLWSKGYETQCLMPSEDMNNSWVGMPDLGGEGPNPWCFWTLENFDADAQTFNLKSVLREKYLNTVSFENGEDEDLGHLHEFNMTIHYEAV